jgi:hypothetical protein
VVFHLGASYSKILDVIRIVYKKDNISLNLNGFNEMLSYNRLLLIIKFKILRIKDFCFELSKETISDKPSRLPKEWSSYSQILELTRIVC